jgi:uncharacterized protein (TIGR02453 family)
MVHQDLIPFLTELGENNSREWFNANKNRYDKLKKTFADFTQQLIFHTSQIDSDLRGLEPSDCIFRIYRDVRFSADKSPYKTNMGAWLVKGGKKSPCAGYYFHVQPGSVFVSGGIYMPDANLLKALRREIYDNIDEFLEIIENKEFKKAFPSLDQDLILSRPPKGYSADFEHIDLIKLKSFTVSCPFTRDIDDNNELLEEIQRKFVLLKPFNRFFNNMIEEM